MTLLILVVDDELLRRTRWFVRRGGAQHRGWSRFPPSTRATSFSIRGLRSAKIDF